MSKTHPSIPAARAGARPILHPLPQGFPNRLADGAVLIATEDAAFASHWLLRSAVGEFVELVIWRSRRSVDEALESMLARPGCRVDPEAARLVHRLDEVPPPRRSTSRPISTLEEL